MGSLDISSPLTGGPRSAGSGPAPTPAPHTNPPSGPATPGADGGVKSAAGGAPSAAYPQGTASRSNPDAFTSVPMTSGRPASAEYGGPQAAPRYASPGRGADSRLGPQGGPIAQAGRVQEASRTVTVEGQGTRESIGPSGTTPQEAASQAQGQNMFGSASGRPRGAPSGRETA